MVGKTSFHGPTNGLFTFRLVTVTAATALMWQFAAATPAHAQQAGTETIEVTGSRIKNTDAASANPISVISSEDIAKTSATTVEDVLKRIPMVDFSSGLSANSNNAGGGNSQMGLHGLGPTRTLILINGQRMVATDSQTPYTAVDLNTIPAAMIDRVEVLRDGASSIYGADAIGGVINIITKKNASGVTAYGSYGTSQHGDGTTYSAGSTLGANFDRGNILLGVNYDKRDPIEQKSRKWATDEFIGKGLEGTGPFSSKLPVLVAGNNVYTGPNGAFINRHDPTGVSQVPDTVFVGGALRYDLSSLALLSGELDRKQISMTGHYDLTDNITAVFEGFYTDRNSREQLNPEPLSSSINTTPLGVYPGFLIPAGAPGNTTGGDLVATYRPFGAGPRIYNDETQTFHTKVGLEGTLRGKYDWQAGYVDGVSNATYKVQNSVNFYHLGQETGQFPCGVDVGCSQANFFNGVNTLTPQQISYLFYTDTRQSQIQEDIAYANIGGPVFDLPAGPVKLNIGTERRSESEWDHPDSVRTAGNADSFAAPTSGGYTVFSGYAEVNVPLIKDVPLIKELTANASTRFDHYSNFGDAATWKSGLNYQMTKDIRFRGSASTGVRAPDVKELYGGASQTFPSFLGDPCDTLGVGSQPNAGIYANSPTCRSALAKVGVNSAAYQSQLDQGSPQVSAVQSGNADLKPEFAHEFTLGTVVTPQIIPNLSIATDYYNVGIHHRIVDGGLGYNYTDTVLAQCYGPLQSQAACSGISRSSLTGDISNMNSPNVNLGWERVQGIDFDVSYFIEAKKMGVPLSGKFLFDGQSSFTFEDTVLQADGTKLRQAGKFNLNSGNSQPFWKGIANVDYAQDEWDVHWDTRMIGGVHNIAGKDAYGIGTDWGNEANAVFYHDISFTYNLTNVQGVKNVRMTFGINNLLDRDPPVIPLDISTTNSLSLGGYDFIGRFFYMKVSAAF